MGDPVRPHRRRRRLPFAALTLLLACSAAVTLHVACGFDVVGSGPAATTRSRDPGDGGAAAIEDANAFDGDAEQAVSCVAPRTICVAICSDTNADPANCGGCGKACTPGQTCNEGKCDVLCVGETLRCNGACIDPTTDPANCGVCNNACASDRNLCVAGACSKSCAMGQKECDPDAGADGGVAYCATIDSDPNNCGACGTVCTTNQSCVKGKCKDLCVGPARVGEVFSPTMVGCVDRR